MHKGRVLIIEDNEMNMDIATQLLTVDGFEVLQAQDGASGLLLANQHQPDIILLDMHLPIKDGFELCKELKSNPKTQHIVILAFTALVMEEDRKKAIACGCATVIHKPLEINEFANTVSAYLPQKQLEIQ